MVLEEPLPWKTLTQAFGECRRCCQSAQLNCYAEHPAECRGLAVHCAGGCALLSPRDLVPPNVGCGDLVCKLLLAEEGEQMFDATTRIYDPELPQFIVLQVGVGKGVEVEGALTMCMRCRLVVVERRDVHRTGP